MNLERILLVALASLLVAGCEKRIESMRLQSDICPEVSVVAVGRSINFYRVVVDIEGHGSHELVANIDMPGDELRYILGLRDSPSGVEILVSASQAVRELDLQISSRCRVRTVGPNSSFKPTPLRSVS